MHLSVAYIHPDVTAHQRLSCFGCCSQVFLKGRAKRHADATDGRGKKAKPVADFRMEGNRTVTYGKIEHVVGYLLLQLPIHCACPCSRHLQLSLQASLTQVQSAEPS